MRDNHEAAYVLYGNFVLQEIILKRIMPIY